MAGPDQRAAGAQDAAAAAAEQPPQQALGDEQGRGQEHAAGPQPWQRAGGLHSCRGSIGQA
eukprot:8435620-Lingulodinium_polyedra.AAC.1